ncbi:MFS transporter [[Mycobacterium] kokjensenii]|uniref:MFS transporter n=1 Tax=[Mycobacterium] kokjensenii TaxID=3064287 RepID=A0ABN9N6A6_9MYCO|nr:MFS transporter [Mycolicibacter sp. MU0083]CAJ1501188.1 MFS transporter [Mycolicibacter sp. MU0083]
MTSDSPAARPRLQREIWILLVANVLIALGYGLVSPVLPVYARHFGVSISATTFLITAFALTRLLFAPVSGLLIQRLGERWVYVTGLLIVSVSTTACAFVQTYGQLLFFRALGGVGSTMFFIAAVGLMIRISPEDARGRVAGLFATAFLLGTVGGPVLGSVTARFGLSAPFLIYGSVLLVTATGVFVSLRHSHLAEAADSTGPTVSVRSALGNRAYRSALLSNFATGWSVFGLRVALVPLFVTEVLGRGPSFAGLTLAMVGIGNVCAVLPSGQLSDRIGRKGLLIVGLVASGVTTMLLGASASLVVFLAVAYLTGVASGIYGSPQQAVISDLVGNQARAGTAVATYQMMADFGSIVGSVAVGLIAERMSFQWGFAVSGVVLLAAAMTWFWAPETRACEPIGGADGATWLGSADGDAGPAGQRGGQLRGSAEVLLHSEDDAAEQRRDARGDR